MRNVDSTNIQIKREYTNPEKRVRPVSMRIETGRMDMRLHKPRGRHVREYCKERATISVIIAMLRSFANERRRVETLLKCEALLPRSVLEIAMEHCNRYANTPRNPLEYRDKLIVAHAATKMQPFDDVRAEIALLCDMPQKPGATTPSQL